MKSLAHPNTAWQLARIVAVCSREKVAIVHAHDFYSNLLGVAAARLSGARVLVSRGDLADWLTPLKRRALGVACRASDRVVANALAVAAVEHDGLHTPPAILRVVPNGIDVDAFDREAPLSPEPAVPELNSPGDTVICIANMNRREKGHHDLIAALSVLAAQGPAPQLLLVGAGAERPYLERRARELGLFSRVCFLGQRRDVPRLLSRARVACSPSWTEGLPNAVLEAMLAARPVVATAVGGCPELLVDEDNGLLVKPRDPVTLAQALSRLLSSRDLAERLGAKARATVVSRYGLEHFGREYERLYLELSA
jgi:glycosyltransferase involved in cell wall biosynthesis